MCVLALRILLFFKGGYTHSSDVFQFLQKKIVLTKLFLLVINKHYKIRQIDV